MTDTAHDTDTAQTLTWSFGGLIATVHPIGHPNMVLAWDLIGGEVFFPHNGATYMKGITKAAVFKREAKGFYAEVFKT